MENLELDNELDRRHLNSMKRLIDEEDDDDDEEDEEDEEDSPRRMQFFDEDINDYNYDRVSADFVLNKGLRRRDKEKSYSLQDLSVYRNDMHTDYPKRRHSSIVRQNYLNIPQNTVMVPATRRKQVMPAKYQHVQSKVKLYIKDIKEQNRRSMEKLVKNHEDMMYGKSQAETHCKGNDTESSKSVASNRTIKDYAEKAIKELEIAEASDKDGITYNASAIILNGQNNKNGLESIQEEEMCMQIESSINPQLKTVQDKRDTVNPDDKVKQKQNGTVEVSFFKRDNQQFGNTNSGMQPSLILNGHQEIPSVLHDLRSLTYDEYMRGTFNQKINLNQNILEQEHIEPEEYDNTDPMDVSQMDDDVTTYPLKIENIKSIETTTNQVKSNNEEINFDNTKSQNEEFNEAASEILTLKDQLNQKTIEYNNLSDTYQKQVAENLKMKQELEELKKSLAKYKKENKPPERKIASVQTDFIIDSVTNKDRNQVESIHVKQSNNKVSASSVASTLSSIEQWTDSTCNLSLSMKPPAVTKTLDSDDSIVLTGNMPKKNSHSPSPAFITSSRILQTLSNITQGKTKLESPLVQNSKKRVLNENTAMDLQNDDSYQNQPSSSKKRKISNVLEPSSSSQFLKVPQNAAKSHLKSNDMPNVEYQLKPPRNLINEKLQENFKSNINTNQGKNGAPMETEIENIDDLENNVKCFVYHENENSKDRSFLILAEEPAKDKINEKERIRECGPFLLGNVEVRMSEINGTINIWGKEVSYMIKIQKIKMYTSNLLGYSASYVTSFVLVIDNR